MALTKDDLKQIRQVVNEEVSSAKEEIVERINREVQDLAEVNHAVLTEISGPTGLKTRVDRIERRLHLEPLKS